MPGLFAPQVDAMNALAQQQQGMPPAPPPSQPQMTPQQQQVDAMDALAQQQRPPSYTGDPTVDRYIHMFVTRGE